MKACIFDLDGTLTDTLESLVYSVRATLREMGLPEITKEQCKSQTLLIIEEKKQMTFYP